MAGACEVVRLIASHPDCNLNARDSCVADTGLSDEEDQLPGMRAPAFPIPANDVYSLTGLPAGTQVAITENTSGYNVTYEILNTDTTVTEGFGAAVVLTVPENKEIIFTNDKPEPTQPPVQGQISIRKQ